MSENMEMDKNIANISIDKEMNFQAIPLQQVDEESSMFDESSDEWIGIYLSNKMVNANIIKNIEKQFNEKYPGIDMKFVKHKGNTNKRGYKQYDAIQW